MNILKAVIVSAALFCASAVAEADPLCAGRGTSDDVKDIPQFLASFADTLFGEGAASVTVYRCMNDQVYVRFQPNGLGCDQPDTRRFNPDVARYCRENPNASIVPKAVSGHGAPYEWKCAGGKAVIDFAEALDARGFRRDMWTAVAGVR